MDEHTKKGSANLDDDGFPIPRAGEDGKPIYDQEFFLALARLGKNTWNRWRAANPYIKREKYIPVTFEDVDFREPANSIIDFSGFAFGDCANLRGCQFSDGPNPWESEYSPSFLPGMAKFTAAAFGAQADLSVTTFGNGANLSGVTFGDRADLSGATFGSGADLSGAIFGYEANLAGVAFGNWANLSGLTFSYWADLSGAIFGYQVDLVGARIGNGVLFNGWSEDKWRQYRSDIIGRFGFAKAWPHDRKQRFLKIPESLAKANAGPDTFLGVSFAMACFLGEADFSGRKFKGEANFKQVRFYGTPHFDACEGFDRVDFTGARVSVGWIFPFAHRLPLSWIHVGDGAVQLRRLRKLVEETKNHDFERDLYIEERKAERGILLAQLLETGEKGEYRRPLYSWTRAFHPRFVGHCLWVLVIAGYALLADYGRSFVRPAIALVVSVPVFLLAYGSVLTAPSDPAGLDDFRRALRAFSIANAVPFVGALTLGPEVKLTLLCGDQPFAGSAAKNKSPAARPKTQATKPVAQPAAQSAQPAAQTQKPVAQPAAQSVKPIAQPSAPSTPNAAQPKTQKTSPPPTSAQSTPPTTPKNTRKCVPIPSGRFQLLVLAQSIFSALCFFFIGLALRNYFKMR